MLITFFIWSILFNIVSHFVLILLPLMFNDALYFCITLLPIFTSSFVNDSFRLKKKPTNPSLPLGLELYVFVYFNYSYNKILSLY